MNYAKTIYQLPSQSSPFLKITISHNFLFKNKAKKPQRLTILNKIQKLRNHHKRLKYLNAFYR